MQLDPLDARALAIAGHVKGYLMHDVRGALSLHARAIELNPNLPIAWTVSSWSRIYNGEHDTGSATPRCRWPCRRAIRTSSSSSTP